MEELKRRLAALEEREAKMGDALLQLGETIRSGLNVLYEADAETEGRMAVFEAITTALLAKSTPATQRYALSAVQIALEAYSDPEGPVSRNPDFLASFRQQAAHLFPDASWTE